MRTLTDIESSLERVRAGLGSRVAALGSRVGDHLAAYVGRPGKMLRSRYALHLGAALGVPEEVCESSARVMELVHNASLLHDDCVDEAPLRRGLPTPNGIFGQTTGILLGDISFTEGMDEAAAISKAAVGALARAVREMTVGELQEEFLRGSLKVSIEGYYGVAARKTGALFEWCGEVLSEASPLPHRREDPPRLGRAAGILLQVVDDIHDFTLSSEVAGKEPGRDFMNGRLTLPGILAMEDEERWPRFMEAWGRPQDKAAFAQALAVLEEGGHLKRARKIARELLDSMLPLAGALPVLEEAAGLKEFMALMARREF